MTARTANVIKGNAVTNTLNSVSSASGGVGIEVSALLEPGDPRRGMPITGNMVFNNSVVKNAGAGIVSATNDNGQIEGNVVRDNGFGTGTSPRDGIQVTYDAAGGANPQTFDLISGNTVKGNGDDGINIVADGNRIVSNITGGNNLNNDGSYDLNDANLLCGSNRWSGNTFGAGSFSQTCETA